MNIQTVRDNLKNTIAGKKQHLKTLNGDLIAGDYVDRTVTKTTIEFLKINIAELKRILQDVEQCIEKETT
jgi:CDP-diacylglycerol pyrophosphatase